MENLTERNQRLAASNQRLNRKAQIAEAQARRLQKEVDKQKAELKNVKSTVASLKAPAKTTMVTASPVAITPPAVTISPKAVAPTVTIPAAQWQDLKQQMISARTLLTKNDTVFLQLTETLKKVEAARTTTEATLAEEKKISASLEVEVNRMEREMRILQDEVTSKTALAKRGAQRINELEATLKRLNKDQESREEVQKDHEAVLTELLDARSASAQAQQRLDAMNHDLAVARENDQTHRQAIESLQAMAKQAEKDRARTTKEATDSRQALLKIEVERDELRHRLSIIQSAFVKVEPRD